MKAKGSIKVLAVQLKEALKVVLPSRPKKKASYPQQPQPQAVIRPDEITCRQLA